MVDKDKQIEELRAKIDSIEKERNEEKEWAKGKTGRELPAVIIILVFSSVFGYYILPKILDFIDSLSH